MVNKALPKVAYFCMEYGLANDLPIFSGGLGILAGDYLKAAQELHMPIVGIGILWTKDYTHQYIGENDYPYDEYPNFDYNNLKDTGVTIDCRVRGADVKCKIWKVDQYNNVDLYLLDTNFPGSEHSWITERLYGGVDQDRVAQEIILGIGGIKALRALDIDIDVYHFNEGHAVFAGLELIREKIAAGLTFAEAWEETKKEVVFTTHTPVEAGNEVHDMGLLLHMEANNTLSQEQLEALGGNPFNMTVAALKMAFKANAVSQLHGQTARDMWRDVQGSAPIQAITNGVHAQTWQNPIIKNNSADLWSTHMQAKNKLIKYIQDNNNVSLDPEVLTIGFARRAAAYKRGGLIFKRMDVLDTLLKENKVQLVYSGKAHPNDHHGKSVIQEIVKISRQYPGKIVFLENYDMDIARLMVQGCDTWLNNPLRPMEASGTSGMKAALNGVLNVSVLDGWVGEAVVHQESGWILDKVLRKNVNEGDQDFYDLEAFYEVLLNEIIPIYYRDKARWIKMMQASVSMAEKHLTSQRMVKEYFNFLYNKAFQAKTKFSYASADMYEQITEHKYQ